MSAEQRTPDELSQNVLICEKVLGWKRIYDRDVEAHFWQHNDALVEARTPSFTTWADAGLILDAMGRDHHIDFGKNSHGQGRWFCAFETMENVPVGEDCGATGPLAIRAAALEYIRSQP